MHIKYSDQTSFFLTSADKVQLKKLAPLLNIESSRVDEEAFCSTVGLVVRCLFLQLLHISNWAPIASQLALTGPIDGQRAHDIVNAYSPVFFGRHLLDRPANVLDGPAKQYPDVLFESRRP